MESRNFSTTAATDMVMRFLKLFTPILLLVHFHVYGNVLYLAKSVPKSEWLGAVHTKKVVISAVHCVFCVLRCIT